MAKHSTKKALIASVLSMTLSASMFVGTTFAWFTDSVESGVNQIVSGNLDVELTHKGAGDGAFSPVKGVTNLFKNANGGAMLWEPNASSMETFKVSNEGSLALKYTFEMNYTNATKTPEGKTLADVLTATVKTPDGQETTATLADFSYDSTLVAGASEEFTVTIAWPQSANDNAFNVKGGLSIDLGVKVFATQYAYEYDGNGNNYDENAPYFTVEVTPETAQDYLDGKYGSLEYATVVFKAGNYDKLYLARPTKYAGSNTTYICGDGNSHSGAALTFESSEEFNAHYGTNEWHTTPRYVTKFQNVTFTAEDGASIAGLELMTGHSYGNVYDYVRDIQYTSGSAYYSTVFVENVTFDGVAFTGTANIHVADEASIVNNVQYKNCSFTTGGTASANGAAIRYYSEMETRNDKVMNLTVENCTFNNVYQGVYTHHANGVKVTGSTFDTTGHNAIAVQCHGSASFDHGNVTIQKNTFNNIGDRIIRFNNVGANTSIAISLNKATNSGDTAGEVIKATSLADGITYDVHTNNWGAGKTVVNPELVDGYTGVTADTVQSKFENVQSGDEVIIVEDFSIEEAASTSTNWLQKVSVNAGCTIDFGGNTVERSSANGDALIISTSEPVVLENANFQTVKGNAVLKTDAPFMGFGVDNPTVTVKNSTFTNLSAPSTGNTGVQAFANGSTFIFENCTFNNMPIVTTSSNCENLTFEFKNCTFNWTGAENGVNCPGYIQLANNSSGKVTLENCKFNYDTTMVASTRQYEFIKTGFNSTVEIIFKGFTMTGVGQATNKHFYVVNRYSTTTVLTGTDTITNTWNGAAVDTSKYFSK